jgi:hypothetical protein
MASPDKSRAEAPRGTDVFSASDGIPSHERIQRFQELPTEGRHEKTTDNNMAGRLRVMPVATPPSPSSLFPNWGPWGLACSHRLGLQRSTIWKRPPAPHAPSRARARTDNAASGDFAMSTDCGEGRAGGRHVGRQRRATCHRRGRVTAAARLRPALGDFRGAERTS